LSPGDEEEPAGKGAEDNGGGGAGDEPRPAPGEAPGSGAADEESLRFYLARLEDDNEGVRWKAAESLGRLGDPAAVDALIDALWDDVAPVRIKAAWALGVIGDPRALRPLQQLYRIENENVREIIETAMERIKARMSAGA